MDDFYMSLVQSLKRYCVELITELGADGIDASLIDWDEHADIHELPVGNLIGVAGSGVSVEDGIYEVSFGVGVSTQNDRALIKLRKIISRVFNDLSPGKQLKFYDATQNTPTEVTWMQMINGTSVVPMTKAETRPFQMVMARALVNPQLPSVL